ncbi:MAG: hypothetical protein IKB02_09995 [Clostridia bacterium]|nr:hypothetical protein [Clostridia bacterium]MBR2389065.1 hypothetical protein [Clostridia bacterium]
MNRIDTQLADEKVINSDIRRELRKNVERGIAGKETDRIQLNDIMLYLLVIIAAAISFTDFTLSFGEIKNFTALTAFLYIVTTLVYNNRYARGKRRGMQDLDYRASLEDYRKKVKAIHDSSIAGLVPTFCKEYKVKELKEYRESLLSGIEMEYEEYKEKYWGKSKREIMRLRLPLDVKRTIFKCNNARPIKLVPSIIFSESGETERNKLIHQSGRDREKKDKRTQVISRAVIVLFGGAIAVDIILNFSLLVIIQWFARMLPILWATITGEDSGYCCVAVTEMNFKKDQSSIIDLFNEWVKERKKSSAEEYSTEDKDISVIQENRQ